MARVNKPTRHEVAYWETRAWKHIGLGFFRCTKTGIRGRIIRYKNGTTGMMWAPSPATRGENGCIIKYLEREIRRTPKEPPVNHTDHRDLKKRPW